MDAVRVYCYRVCNCDIGKLFSFCCKCASRPNLCLHLVSYGIPLITVLALAILCPDVYLPAGRRHYYWLSIPSLAEAAAAFSPAIAAVLAAGVLLLLVLVSGRPSEHKEPRDQRESHLLPPLIILTFQAPNWILANLYFHQPNSSIFFTSSFAVINIVQAVVLFVLCFSQNDRVRGNIQSSLAKVQWLPQCVRAGKNSTGALVSTSAPQTPAYFYALDPSQLAPPPSPLIRQTLHHQHHHQHTLGRLDNAPNNLGGGGHRGYIPEVNPYAAPVPVPMHEYEDITAMRDINSFGVTLPHNYGQRESRAASRLNNQQSLRRSHPAEETLYYEACRDGPVIYGRNSTPNYCFHNTR